MPKSEFCEDSFVVDMLRACWPMRMCGVVQVEQRLAELQNTLEASIHHRDNVLNTVGKQLDEWTVMVSRDFDPGDIVGAFILEAKSALEF